MFFIDPIIKDKIEEEEEEKNKIPALQEVGGSLWRSLSSFKIRLEAIGGDGKP